MKNERASGNTPKALYYLIYIYGARDRGRTGTMLPSRDFKNYEKRTFK